MVDSDVIADLTKIAYIQVRNYRGLSGRLGRDRRSDEDHIHTGEKVQGGQKMVREVHMLMSTIG